MASSASRRIAMQLIDLAPIFPLSNVDTLAFGALEQNFHSVALYQIASTDFLQ